MTVRLFNVVSGPLSKEFDPESVAVAVKHSTGLRSEQRGLHPGCRIWSAAEPFRHLGACELHPAQPARRPGLQGTSRFFSFYPLPRPQPSYPGRSKTIEISRVN